MKVIVEANDIEDAKMLKDQKTVRFIISGQSAQLLWEAFLINGLPEQEQIEEIERALTPAYKGMI
jgi:hypothetical protein